MIEPVANNRQDFVMNDNDSSIRQTIRSHISFYGLFWEKQLEELNKNRLFGIPIGKIGQGNLKNSVTDDDISMNFWT
jgi:hypothetical protein